MSDGWFPDAISDPGVAAGYTRGRAMMSAAVLHYTVGVNSAGIGRNGYFQFLFPKVGQPLQFCEADAVAWHAGNWNMTGPGLEFERLSDEEPLTADQLSWGGRVIRWINEEWGVPLEFRDTPEARIKAGFSGFITHRSLDQAPDNHTDYVTQDDWFLMTAPVSADTPEELAMPDYVMKLGDQVALVTDDRFESFLSGQVTIPAGVAVVAAETDQWNAAFLARQPKSETGRGVNVEAVVLAAVQAVRLAPKGTNATKDAMVPGVERAVRAALA